MLKYVGYDIVFQEIPDETTLAVNLSNCPHCCRGCHSPWLQEDVGEELTMEVMEGLLLKYGSSVTCVCLMGGDASFEEVACLAAFLKSQNVATVKVGWYSGRSVLPPDFPLRNFDYIKLGAYQEKHGPLTSPTTNQRLYQIAANGKMTDWTYKFWHFQGIPSSTYRQNPHANAPARANLPSSFTP